MSLEGALFGVGLDFALFAFVWRARRRREARELLRRALVDRDPAMRIAAIQVAANEGLARYATMLLERRKHESDPRVVSVLAQVVVDKQWVPADNAALMELRLWAYHYLAGPPAVAIGATRAEPVERSPDVVDELLPVRYKATRRPGTLRLAVTLLWAAAFISPLVLWESVDDDEILTSGKSVTAAVTLKNAAVEVLPTTASPTTASPATASPTTASPTTAAPIRRVVVTTTRAKVAIVRFCGCVPVPSFL